MAKMSDGPKIACVACGRPVQGIGPLCKACADALPFETFMQDGGAAIVDVTPPEPTA